MCIVPNLDSFDKLLAFYCAPTLAGIKSGSLLICNKAYASNIEKTINKYNQILNDKGIFFYIFNQYDSRALILVYNEPLLSSELNSPKHFSFLKQLGYNTEKTIKDTLDCLKKRIVNMNFPHEIGLFLGYPYEDVIGFIENKGKGYKYCGYWKVYTSTSKAKDLFNQYTLCRTKYYEKICSGTSILQLINVA